jgi:hypothetical protein
MVMDRALLPTFVSLAVLAGLSGTANAQERYFRLKNGSNQEMTIFVKYINTEGQVRTLKLDRQPTIVPGEQALIAAPADIATYQQGSLTMYQVAVSVRSPGRLDRWWGVHSENGQVVNKSEFTGMSFQSYTTVRSDGRTVRYLSRELKVPD